MRATWTWVRSDLRREWRATTALVLLVGLGGAVVLTTVAGARRTSSAFDRLREHTDSADVRVQYSTDDPIDDQVLASLRSHPDVELAVPIYITIGFSEATAFDLGVFASPEPELLHDVDRPMLLEGRTADVDEPHEVTTNPFTAESLGAGVGDTIDLATFSPEQVASFDFGPPAGPRIELTIVGIGRLPDDVADEAFIGIFGTPAFLERYGSEAGGYGPSIEVLLRDGVDPVRTAEDALAAFSFDELILTTGDELAARTEDGTRVLVLGLIAFALAAGLASLVACGQALHRRLAAPTTDHAILRALGFTRSQRIQATILPAVPVALGGAVLAGAISVPASTLLPIGRARLAEPDPGVAVDLLVLGLGVVAILAVTLLLGAIGAWRIGRRSSDLTSGVVPAGGSTRAVRAARATSSPAVQVGVTMALEPGRGRTAVPVRSAIGGAIAGIAGVVAALTFASSLDALVDTPSRYGWNWSFAPDVADEDLPTLVALPGVEDVGIIEQRQVIVEGEQTVAMAMVPEAGRPTFTILRGRMPAADDEVVLGPKRADHLSVAVGDAVDMEDSDGGTRSMLVVGEALFPTFDDSAFNDTVAVTGDAIDDLAVSDGDGRPVVSFAAGISEAEAHRRITEALPDSLSIYAFATPPGDVVNLSQVRSLPRTLALFLVLVALAAVGHALATSVRRRRRDLGVLRSIGFVSHDVRTTIAVQSTTLLVIGLAVGMPLGVVIGRLVWSLVAGGLGVAVAPVVPAGILVALVPSAAIAALLLAGLPARAATRVRAAEALRAE